MRDTKCFTGGVHKFAFQRFFGSERHGMQQQMQLAEFFGHRLENVGDFFVARDVARKDQSVRAESAGKFLDVFLEPFALVSEREFGSGLVPCLRDGPRNGAFVGDAEYDSEFACK